MKSVSKKLLSLLLVAIMMVSVIPFQAFAVEPTCGKEEHTHDASCKTLTCTKEEHTHVHATCCSQPDLHSDGCINCGCSKEAHTHDDATCKTLTCTKEEHTHSSACYPAATPVAHSDASHGAAIWNWTATGHQKKCPVENCELNSASETPHVFADAGNGKHYCPTCDQNQDHLVDHAAPTDKPGSEKAATCTEAGKEADKWCADCKTVLSTGDVIPATGHSFGSDGKCTNPGCTVSGTPADSKKVTITYDGNDGTFSGGGKTGTKDAYTGKPLTLPTPTRDGFTFLGWKDENGDDFYSGSNYAESMGTTFTAQWLEKTNVTKIVRLLDGKTSTAQIIYRESIPVGVKILDIFGQNDSAAKKAVRAELEKYPGYEWDGGFWYDYSKKTELIGQTATGSEAQTVYVNFKPVTFKLYFNANGGTVSVTEKTVTYGKAVGDLPTPTKKDCVFLGWEDANGKLYQSSTIYEVAGDTSLKARWEDQAKVLLCVYINGKTTGDGAPDRYIPMDGYVKNGVVTRTDVEKEIKKFYSPASGTSIQIDGLFDSDTWPGYLINNKKTGTPTVEVVGDHTYVYVMLKNVKQGGTANGGSSSNSKTNSGDNPKTGDNAYIYTASTVMLVAAAAFVTVYQLRKRKMF